MKNKKYYEKIGEKRELSYKLNTEINVNEILNMKKMYKLLKENR